MGLLRIHQESVLCDARAIREQRINAMRLSTCARSRDLKSNENHKSFPRNYLLQLFHPSIYAHYERHSVLFQSEDSLPVTNS